MYKSKIMKNYIQFLSILFISGLFAQNRPQNLEQLAQAEMKSASKTQNLAVNLNTQNYNITYHKLEFTVNPAVYFIAGKITTTYTAVANMTTITFDMANELTVSSVKKNGVNLVFAPSGNNELVITLPAMQATGTSATLEIAYSGAPPINGFQAFSRNNHGTGDIIYTLSEPFGARDWWPCKQDLNDKIDSIDVYITAPSQFTAVSNGVEPEAPVVVGGQKITHFHHGYAIPAYLICMAVSNYQVYNQVGGTAPNTYPIVNYLYPQDAASVTPQLAQTPLILNLFENLYETYPFKNEKYGHCQFGWGGGMEHTTVSFMVNFDRDLIAHEMAHQWFGDKITCGTWQDIWLNESFATYVAAQVIENFDGISAFVNYKSNMISYITSDPTGSVFIPAAEANDVNRVFDYRLSYLKGAMVIEMLRFKMGDAMFFQAIKNYLADVNLAYKYAVTSNLKAHLEAVYGSSLTEFFNDWVINQGHPEYDVTAENIGGGQVKFVVNQTQSDASVSFFEMPIPVKVFGAGGASQDLILDNSSNGQVIIKNVPFVVTSISFDPEKHLLSTNNTVSVLPTLSTANYDLNEKIAVAPNPTTNNLNISLPNNIQLENSIIFNLLGQKILENNSNKIDVTNLSSGVYSIQVKTDAGLVVKKFVKE